MAAVLIIFICMLVEFAIACLIGLCNKQWVKIVAKFHVDSKIVLAKKYDSIYFGRNFPRQERDPFLLAPEFILIKFKNNDIVIEEFFTFLGSSIKVKYENGICKGSKYSTQTCPIYSIGIVIPIFVGLLFCLVPIVGGYFSLLLLSGFGWIFLTLLLQMRKIKK
jgi:hypothetical protein